MFLQITQLPSSRHILLCLTFPWVLLSSPFSVLPLFWLVQTPPQEKKQLWERQKPHRHLPPLLQLVELVPGGTKTAAVLEMLQGQMPPPTSSPISVLLHGEENTHSILTIRWVNCWQKNMIKLVPGRFCLSRTQAYSKQLSLNPQQKKPCNLRMAWDCSRD